MSETPATQPPLKQPPRALRALRAMKDRRMVAMTLLAFAAGLPMGATLGLLNAWLTEVGITPATIGVLSLVTLGYAFKYLWAPLFQDPRPFPFLARLGARRSWLLVLQIALAALLALFAFSDPTKNMALVAFGAFLITLLSPTHDLLLDAWRIEVARSDVDKDMMSALYQLGYKSAGFVTGFFALLIAEHYGWVIVFLMVAGFMLLSVVGTLLAPEPESSRVRSETRETFYKSLPHKVTLPAIMIVAFGWLIAFGMIVVFVIQAFGPEGASGSAFVRNEGPWIVAFTVVLPALVSAFLIFRSKAHPQTVAIRVEEETKLQAAQRILFRSIFDPMMDLIFRLRWGALLVLLLALTYRFTDAVWGSFAYPFYLGENFGALGHSLADVAIASKLFGVIATILGSLMGAVLIGVIGRMPVFFLGGVVAAVTNLLYADLAAGAVAVDSFLAFTHLDAPLIALADWGSTLSASTAEADHGQRMARLMVTIFAENIAGGLALVAITAYLTSVVNPRFAAVQYALLASLTMLIGTLGRPWLGEMIEKNGFYDVFIITFWLGGVAVVLSAIEWVRQARLPKQDEATTPIDA
ncbi:MAG: AmpG family muropeptide MFS transporter [Alphaproteobacteria bacterium]|nr:beta-lactamase induction signal transducer [Hyphomonas sp.]MBR9806378.1 AmpG family muropeptide MFS transporter [Alphaproteobacteria bacterium]